MRSKKNQQPPVASGAGEGLKGRALDVGPAADAGAGEKRGTTASQTQTTRRLDRAVKQNADEQMAGKEKAVERWEGEGGAVPPAKKGRRK